MQTDETLEATPETTRETHPWRLVTRVAFRFCVAYFGLFCLTFAQITFVFVGVLARWLPAGAVSWQMTSLQPLTQWVGQTLFGVEAVLRLESGSGDQAAIWVLVFCQLVVAVAVTAVWSIVDRRRTQYARLAAFFLVFLRLCLGGQMLFYGFAKVIPTQMPSPPLAALLERFGDLSPMAVLWLQVGSSHPYEIALGAVEVTAGLLLFWPRTATLGTLVSLVGTGQIFLLNMTYDVPVKILSFHLLLISLLLLAPQLRRLADLLVLGRRSDPLTQPALFASPRHNRIAAAVQVAIGVWVLVGCVILNASSWFEFGDGRTKPDDYGIWSVTDFIVAGRPRPPLTTDQTRWQHVVFDQPGLMTYQRMDGELVDVAAEIGPNALVLKAPAGSYAPPLLGTFTVDRSSRDRMSLAGTLDGRPVTITLQRESLDEFTLRNRGFHWQQEAPFFG